MNGGKNNENALLERIMDRIKENSDTLAAIDKKLDLHIQETRYELKAIRDLDGIQNAILEEHHKRSDRLAEDNALREAALRADMKVQDSRIEKLESPRKWWATTKKWLIGLGGVAAAIVAFYEAVQYLLGK